MITLRKLIGNINMTKEPEQQSPGNGANLLI